MCFFFRASGTCPLLILCFTRTRFFIVSSSERKFINSPVCFGKYENVTLFSYMEILVDVWWPEGEGCIWRPSYLNLVTAMISNCSCVLLEVWPVTVS
jgi:hypothetical protein